MFFKSCILISGIFLFLFIPFLHAQDYSLDYSITGISGCATETTDYKIVDFVSELGICQETQSSLNYSIIPVVGMEEETTAVQNWMLYL